MSKYVELDEAIIARLKQGPASFIQLDSGEIEKLADSLAPKDYRGDSIGWRLIDRRLQALRKAGRIYNDRRVGWQIKN